MLRSGICIFLFLSQAFAAGVTVRFDAADPAAGPFPSDAFTIPDSAQKTSRRVNLPLPNCDVQPSACSELTLVNQLDGFSVVARVRASFSAAVNTASLTAGVQIVALDNLTQEESGIYKPGDVIRINQAVYDSATNTVYAKPDSVLDQHRRYALIVTDAVKDAAGDAVGADPAYRVCAQGNGGDYCAALAAALPALTAAAAPRAIVAASIFTTQSATAWLESARGLLDSVAPSVKMLQPKSRFKVSDYAGIVLNEQTGVDPVKLSSFSIPLDPSLLQGLGSVAIGSFQSPNFLDAAQMIAPVPTGSAPPLPDSTSEVFFNALLPTTDKPPAGYPVVIFGHGFGDSRFGGPTAVSPTLAGAGFAVIAINAVGHGFGPQSTVSFVDAKGSATTIPAGGRSVDLNGDGVIEGNEGCVVTIPVSTVTRDCFRQTAVDLLQLVRALRAGIDLDGDGKPDLDGARIYYAGQSLGAIYGTILSTLTPDVRAVALNVGGASVSDIARWSPSYHDLVTNSLRVRQPSLLNAGQDWDQDYVLRDQPVKNLAVTGALDIQNFFETTEWLSNSGDPVAFAPHLKTSPLPGVAAKPVLVQFARGDRTVPNPANSALIRAANLRENSWMYRHDKARAYDGSLPLNPHAYLMLFVNLEGDSIQLPTQNELVVSGLAQQQIAGFFTSDGAAIPNPNNALLQFLLGFALFEVPAKLPEDLGY